MYQTGLANRTAALTFETEMIQLFWFIPWLCLGHWQVSTLQHIMLLLSYVFFQVIMIKSAADDDDDAL